MFSSGASDFKARVDLQYQKSAIKFLQTAREDSDNDASYSAEEMTVSILLY